MNKGLECLSLTREHPLMTKKITGSLKRYTLPENVWIRILRHNPEMLPFTEKDVREHVPETGCIYMDDRVQYFVEVKLRGNNERKQPIHPDPNKRKPF